MTFGELLFWVIVLVIAYYAYMNGTNILIILIALLVLNYLIGWFNRPTMAPVLVPINPPPVYGAYPRVEPFSGMEKETDYVEGFNGAEKDFTSGPYQASFNDGFKPSVSAYDNGK